MEGIGHTIYSGLWGLLCMVDTIYCGVRKEGEGEEEGKRGEALVLDMLNT